MPIISAVTPLVLGALDLYRRRSEARATAVMPADAAQLPLLAESLQKRIQALDESDLEQARLLSELSKNVEALARALESQAQAAEMRERAFRRWLVALTAATVLALGVAIAAWV